MEEMKWNEYQSSLEELGFEDQPDEIKEQFMDCINNIPFVKWLISKDRPRAKDLPRDGDGKIIVDLTQPHILENMDYFRPTALHYKKTGRMTDLRPNANPNSEYGKWIREEIRRCHYGYIRPEDGEWVTGDMYWFLNYWPIQQTKFKKGSKKGERFIDFPEVWDGIYLRYHYIYQAINGGKFDWEGGKNGCEISSRGKSKSYVMSSMIGKRFVLGETPIESENSERKEKQVTKCMATAYQKQYLTSDGLLNKFQSGIDFLAQNTQFPRKRLKSSLQDMAWRMGYLDLDTGTYKGTLNEVVGVSAKDDPSKVRGKRMNLIVVEEFGSFPNVLELYNIMIPSVQEGDISFGTMYLIGTAGDEESDFQGAQEIIYNPKGYRMYGIPNVYDMEGTGRREITFFFPGYLDRKGCYDENGNSNVTQALMEILIDRYTLKYNSSDINSITKRIAEIPITPQEAILRVRGNLFPVTQLSEHLNQLDNDPSQYDNILIGDLITNADGNIEFKPSSALPIREFPTKDNKVEGALEIFELPQTKGKEVYNDRYIAGIDPIDQDSSETMSLYSVFVLDLWTDRIVAEYTGRPMFADDAYELTRKLLIFYNAKACYENNLKGIFSYFSMRNCTHLLCDTPQYLKDKNLIKLIGYGNLSKGVRATAPINNYANQLIRDWLLQPVNTVVHEDGEDKEIQVNNLYFIKNRALLKELIAYNPEINVDRIRALGMLMLYREEKIIKYQGDFNREEENYDYTYLGNDKFFTANYDDRFGSSSNSYWF